MYEQQWRYFYKVAGIDDPHPIELFNKHLFALIKECRLINEQVVLMINANKDVYKRKFAKAIARQGVDLESAYDRVHEERMLSSHVRGSNPHVFFCLARNQLHQSLHRSPQPWSGQLQKATHC